MTASTNEFQGRTYVITGGASGLGLESARHLAARGANLVLADVDTALLARAAAELPAERTSTIPADVRKPADCEAMMQLAVARYGGLDGAVCSAGIDAVTPALETPLEVWQRVIDVNLTGSFLSAQAAARALLAGGRRGSIVTFASGIAVRGRAGGPHYAASKAGIVGLSKSLALEFARHGIRVNAVAPGIVDTPFARKSMNDAQLAARAGQVPLGRIGEPEDIAPVVAFLLSDASSWMTGQTLHANGGMLMV
jgi:NAD(P)-dependent dehydrogenase (short-subunit alcohol dehydrogenase family)